MIKNDSKWSDVSPDMVSLLKQSMSYAESMGIPNKECSDREKEQAKRIAAVMTESEHLPANEIMKKIVYASGADKIRPDGKPVLKNGSVVNYDGIRPFTDAYNAMSSMYDNSKNHQAFIEQHGDKGVAELVRDRLVSRYSDAGERTVADVMPKGNGKNYGFLINADRNQDLLKMGNARIQEIIEDEVGIEDDGNRHIFCMTIDKYSHESDWMIVACDGYPQEMKEDIAKFLEDESRSECMMVDLSGMMFDEIKSRSWVMDAFASLDKTAYAAESAKNVSVDESLMPVHDTQAANKGLQM